MPEEKVPHRILSAEEKEAAKQALLAKPVQEILAIAKERGKQAGLPCAGEVLPLEAWALLQTGAATLLDVRTVEEYKFVGHTPIAVHVPLTCGPNMSKNHGFLYEVEKTIPKDACLLILCRSGRRSAGACELLTKAGYTQIYNIMEGFEGDLDRLRRRGNKGGWRYWGLDWVQD